MLIEFIGVKLFSQSIKLLEMSIILRSGIIGSSQNFSKIRTIWLLFISIFLMAVIAICEFFSYAVTVEIHANKL